MVLGALGAQLVSACIPLVVERIIDGALADSDRHALVVLSVVLLALGVTEGGLLCMRRYTLARAASTMEMRLRGDIYAHLQRLSLRFHDTWQTGQLLSRAMSDTNLIFRGFVAFAAVFFIANLATFVVVAVILVGLDPLLALVTAAMSVPIGVLSSRFRRSYRVASRVRQDTDGDLATFVEESALGIRVTTSFGRSALADEQFARLAGTARDAALRAVRLKAGFISLLTLLSDLTLAFVMGGGAWAVAHGSLTVGGLVAFLSLLLMLVWPVQSLGEIMALTHEAASATDRIFEVLDVAPDLADPAGAASVRTLTGAGAIVLRDVTFRYGDGPAVLDHLDLDVRAGETLAIVGRTGSGKSTLCTLLPRLVDVTDGAVEIDGHDVRDVPLDEVRRNVAMVFEDPLLLSASVRENLLLGAPQAGDDQIDAVLEVCQAQFVRDLPWGLDTRIGEQGVSLSGGQRQRLALARAIICAPPVLVLDDPLSALDVATEAEVHGGLRDLLHGTTVVITAHRPSTVALADRVAFLEDGRIAAVGTHRELMDRLPAYRDVLSQSAERMAG